MSPDRASTQTVQDQDYEALLEDTMRELATNEPDDEPGLMDATLDGDVLTTAWFIAGFDPVGGDAND
ncbi:hypothetical protein [Micromonospora sp. LOL_015]|jgi:hypothetical protein|uniref:hypothetical protein n=1 Tax=Micromonospora sp. LOL_015 TaxID=3345416 RepID=UPI003A85EB5C